MAQGVWQDGILLAEIKTWQHPTAQLGGCDCNIDLITLAGICRV